MRQKLIRIYSHPRSGTHYLAALMGMNFYPFLFLSKKNIERGHWSDRKVYPEGFGYAKLFGSHRFPAEDLSNIGLPALYIYRDGRAVAWSVWKTPGCLHQDLKGISFPEFLRMKLDWTGSPGMRDREKNGYTIGQHWKAHVEAWHRVKARHYLILRYEDLVLKTDETLLRIREKFPFLIFRKKFKNPLKLVGHLPNEGSTDAWKEHYRTEDLDYFRSAVGEHCPYLYS